RGRVRIGVVQPPAGEAYSRQPGSREAAHACGTGAAGPLAVSQALASAAGGGPRRNDATARGPVPRGGVLARYAPRTPAAGTPSEAGTGDRSGTEPRVAIARLIGPAAGQSCRRVSGSCSGWPVWQGSL